MNRFGVSYANEPEKPNMRFDSVFFFKGFEFPISVAYQRLHQMHLSFDKGIKSTVFCQFILLK